MNPTSIVFKKEDVNGLKIFYRQAGDPTKSAVLLLHGFPTSSHMFRNLIPLLASDHYVIAPDLPGFGFSDAPDHASFPYTFARIAQVMGDFVEQLGLKKFAIYVFDYGAPTGFRLALRFPERISAIISQNGNAYVEGTQQGLGAGAGLLGKSDPGEPSTRCAPCRPWRQPAGNITMG